MFTALRESLQGEGKRFGGTEETHPQRLTLDVRIPTPSGSRSD